MYEKFKLLEHEHTLRLRGHQHTSYLSLAVVLLIVGVTLLFATVSAYASPGPQSGSIGLTGIMPEKPPTEGATITSPNNGQHFATSPITVSGTCPQNLLVEIYKNDIFAGSIPCDSSGKFSLQIDLLYGQNDLTAQVFDSLNQAGPVSKTVTVFYDASLQKAAQQNPLSFTGAQMVLLTNAVYRGNFPNQQLNVPITILGGTPPFAVNVQWGDSKTSTYPRPDNTVFNVNHTYAKPGVYEITFQGTDSKQQVAFLKVAAIINGQPSTVASTNDSSTNTKTNKFLLLWPLFAIAVALVLGFWIGERREKKIMLKKNPPNTGLGLSPQPHL